MTTALVGYTGFVGTNLAASHAFTHLYHSKNIEEAYGTCPDLLVYAGVRAEKFLANRNPEGDLAHVREAFENIRRIRPKKLVLISTVDVYPYLGKRLREIRVDEAFPISEEELAPYGRNRFFLEQQVRKEFPDALIVRLPGLYGTGIKKNFIYDLIHRIPSMLREEKFLELNRREEGLSRYYEKQDNGFYKCRNLEREEKQELRAYFERAGFSAVHFTDSRGVFQFYPLSLLWGHVEQALALDLRLVNLFTEPIEAGELYRALTGEPFENPVSEEPPFYDYRSGFAVRLGKESGYLLGKEYLLQDICRFIEEERKKA